MKLIYWLASALAAAMLVALSACSDKPPGCADDEVRTTATELIVGEARKHVAIADDPEGLMPKYLDKSTVTLTNIVDDGYHPDQKKQSCKAHIKVMPPEGDGLEGDVAYTTQRVLDAKGKFLLEMDSVDQFAMTLVTPARAYFEANAYLGSYSGTYECSGVGGAQARPPGPFSQQVTLNVLAAPGSPRPQATLERISRGGGVEKLTGAASNQFDLVGEGANTPDDRWITGFRVTISGNAAKGDGNIRVPNFGIARHCTLDLVKGAAQATSTVTPETAALTGATAQPTATGSGFPGKYVGTGDGTVTVEVGQPNASGSYPVSVATQASTAGGGGCGGSASGEAGANGNGLRLVATDKTLGTTCTVTLTPGGKGGLHSEEGDGCSVFHGAACGFSADLARR